MSDKKRPRETGANASAGKKKLKLGDIIDLNSLNNRSKIVVEANLLMHKRDKARNENNVGKSNKIKARLHRLGVDVFDQTDGPSVRFDV
jgi:cysteinyl-tRNA synthetase